MLHFLKSAELLYFTLTEQMYSYLISCLFTVTYMQKVSWINVQIWRQGTHACHWGGYTISQSIWMKTFDSIVITNKIIVTIKAGIAYKF